MVQKGSLQSPPNRKIFLCAGGTGGHVIPAEIVGHKLSALGYQDVTIVVDQRGQKYLSSWQGDVRVVPIRQGHWALRIASVGLAVIKIGWRFLWDRPDLVIGFGGYPAASGALAAIGSRVPLMIHEQNAVLGRVNRWLAPWACRVFLSFEQTKKAQGFSKEKKIVLSYPLVRGAFLQESMKSVSIPPHFTKDKPLRILVTGGSQGSLALARLVKEMIPLLSSQDRSRLYITLQVPESLIQGCVDIFNSFGVVSEVASFFRDLPTVMKDSHLMIARSGASTVSEILQVGIGCVLIPLPHSASQHQFYNCAPLLERGRAWRFEEKNISGTFLSTFIHSLLRDPSLLETKKDKEAKKKTNKTAPEDPSFKMVSVVDSFLKGLHK